MRAPRFTTPPMQDTIWLARIKSLVKLATFEGVYGGRAMTLRPM